MRAVRRIERNGAQSLRGLTAVVALYALVLQAVLGGIAALPTMPAHDVLCLQQQDDGGRDAPTGGSARHHEAGCCVTAPAVAFATPPSPPPAFVTWPRRAETRLAWSAETVFSARAPPPRIAAPRAPPVA